MTILSTHGYTTTIYTNPGPTFLPSIGDIVVVYDEWDDTVTYSKVIGLSKGTTLTEPATFFDCINHVSFTGKTSTTDDISYNYDPVSDNLQSN